MKKIGFVGLGSMGLPMACHLLDAGFAVRGYDINPSQLQVFENAGGEAADNLAEAAEGSDVLVLMVVNGAQAHRILIEENLIERLPAHAIVCLMSTCAPSEVQALAKEVIATGREFVDSPVSGGVAGAQRATLTIMAGCRAKTLEAIRPVLEPMASRLMHVGEQPGQGAMVKSINQLLCGVHLAAAAEALSLGAKVGVNLETLLDIVGGSAASSWMLCDRGPRMLRSEPEITSAIDIFVKDLEIVMAAGRDNKSALPLASLAHQLFLSVSGMGDGAADDSQVIRAYQRLNGAT